LVVEQDASAPTLAPSRQPARRAAAVQEFPYLTTRVEVDPRGRKMLVNAMR